MEVPAHAEGAARVGAVANGGGAGKAEARPGDTRAEAVMEGGEATASPVAEMEEVLAEKGAAASSRSMAPVVMAAAGWEEHSEEARRASGTLVARVAWHLAAALAAEGEAAAAATVA